MSELVARSVDYCLMSAVLRKDRGKAIDAARRNYISVSLHGVTVHSTALRAHTATREEREKLDKI